MPETKISESIEIAKSVFEVEAETLNLVKDSLDDNFVKAVDLIHAATGRVVVTGMGKSGHIGAKIAATLASTGTSSFFVHPAEMGHGDLGMVLASDVVLALSYSGRTEELRKILVPIKKLGAKVIAITGGTESPLANYADSVLYTPITKEACPLDLAPTSSTTAALAMGDALAVALMTKNNFKKDDFARSHPLGSLGQSIVPISDVMRSQASIPSVAPDANYSQILAEISDKELGFTAVVDSANKLLGVITDGDLRRAQIKFMDQIFQKNAADIMSASPKTMKSDDLAIAAAKMMEKNRIGQIVIVDDSNIMQGVLDLKDLLSAGFMVS
ncbi:MAG: KpsF/GutQ family sugar-phosphate isomerase [Candidatus Caenarcaniphilales bacterium]|nr:KpsF/GutQ family sugar-phosphate isomerase [Candidatus Caenarcaniphilales bacterium]